MHCQAAQRDIWAHELTPETAIHVTNCPECRLEAQRAQGLLGGLQLMQRQMSETPPGLRAAILSSIASQPNAIQRALNHPSFWKNLGVGVGAAAATAAAVGIAVSRRRSARLEPAA